MSLQSQLVSHDPSSERVAIAQRIYRERRIRDSLFQTLSNEPGWDILLDMFVAFEQSGVPRAAVRRSQAALLRLRQ